MHGEPLKNVGQAPPVSAPARRRAPIKWLVGSTIALLGISAALFARSPAAGAGVVLQLAAVAWIALNGRAYLRGISFDPMWLADPKPVWSPRKHNSVISIIQAGVIAVALLTAPVLTITGQPRHAVLLAFSAGMLLGPVLSPPTHARGDGNVIIVYCKNLIGGGIWKSLLVGAGAALSAVFGGAGVVAGGLGIWCIATFMLIARLAAARTNYSIHKHGGIYREAVEDLEAHGHVGLICAFLLALYIPVGAGVTAASPLPPGTVGGILGLALSHIIGSAQPAGST